MSDIWRNQQFYGLIALTIYFCFLFSKRYGKLVATALCYTLLSAVYLFMNPNPLYAPQELQGFLDSSSAKSFIILIMITMTVLYLNKKSIHRILDMFEILFAINAVVVIFNGFGLFNARSSDTATIACILPSIWFRKERNFWYQALTTALILASIVITKGSTSYFVLVAIFIAYAVQAKSWRLLYVIPFVFLFGYLRERHEFLDSSRRVEYWCIFMQWFYDNANIWLGTTLGSFKWLGPYIQANITTPKQMHESGWFLFMHNEYLQVLFETGIIGYILAQSIWFNALYKARKNLWLFCSLAAVSMLFVTQFPLRFILSAFLIAIFVRLALYGDEIR